MPDKFKMTAKQEIASELMAGHMYTLLFGGRRSAKTFIIIRNILMRALSKKSRHIAVRRTFSSIHHAVWLETLPDVLSYCFPVFKEGAQYKLNRSDYFLEFRNGSTFWIGGLDDKERMEKILGREYSTGYINESSNVKYDGYEIVLSGLAENSGLPLLFLGDCNPPSKKHWTYKLFIEGINPEDNKKLSPERRAKYASLIMNPIDNKENLPETYFDILDGLSKRKRDRFRDGLFSSDKEGALWNHEMINNTRIHDPEAGENQWMKNPPQTVVALDPNVSEGKNKEGEFVNDEAGIIVCSKDRLGRGPEGKGFIEADYSGEYSTKEWASKAVWAYHRHNANCIVAEVNQGGALVKDVIKAENPNVKIVMVRASKGKVARAEPVTVLYEDEKIKHADGLDELEDELLEYIPGQTESPNRMDALVWGKTYLFFGQYSDVSSGVGAAIL